MLTYLEMFILVKCSLEQYSNNDFADRDDKTIQNLTPVQRTEPVIDNRVRAFILFEHKDGQIIQSISYQDEFPEQYHGELPLNIGGNALDCLDLFRNSSYPAPLEHQNHENNFQGYLTDYNYQNENIFRGYSDDFNNHNENKNFTNEPKDLLFHNNQHVINEIAGNAEDSIIIDNKEESISKSPLNLLNLGDKCNFNSVNSMETAEIVSIDSDRTFDGELPDQTSITHFKSQKGLEEQFIKTLRFLNMLDTYEKRFMNIKIQDEEVKHSLF